MSLSAVARVAGVSVSTVSRYVRGELKLRPETEDAIMRAMTKTGYDPRAPIPGSERTVAVVLPELTNPFFAELAQSMSHQALGRSLNTAMYLTGGDPNREAQVVEELLLRSTVSGIFCIGMRYDNPALLASHSTPLVMVDEPVKMTSGVSRPFVSSDSYGGAFAATRYLISLGHRRIAHIGGPSTIASSDLRERGYRDALEQAGIPFDESIVFHGPHSETFGANTLSYMGRVKEPPTAIFATSDIAAIGVLSAASIHGLSLPDDLSIVGFDGIGIGSWLQPALTTIAQPIHELATAALSAMDQIWAGKQPADTQLPMNLIIRESARPLNGH